MPTRPVVPRGLHPVFAIAAILLIVLVLVVLIDLLGKHVPPEYASFSTVVWAPSLIAAGASLWVFYNQQKASAGLELLKADLTRDLERHRTELAKDLEFIKGKLAAERKGYDELHAAAILYYYTLAKLEVGKLTPELLAKAEDSMLAACRYSAFIPENDREQWMQVWQAARAAGEKAAQVNPAGQPELWKGTIDSVAIPMKAFAEAVRQAHQTA